MNWRAIGRQRRKTILAEQTASRNRGATRTLAGSIRAGEDKTLLSVAPCDGELVHKRMMSRSCWVKRMAGFATDASESRIESARHESSLCVGHAPQGSRFERMPRWGRGVIMTFELACSAMLHSQASVIHYYVMITPESQLPKT